VRLLLWSKTARRITRSRCDVTVSLLGSLCCGSVRLLVSSWRGSGCKLLEPFTKAEPRFPSETDVPLLQTQSARTARVPKTLALSCCLLQTSKKQQCAAAVLSCTAAAATLLPRLLLPVQLLLPATCSSRQLHGRLLVAAATAWQ
jgi:hypothetical protein